MALQGIPTWRAGLPAATGRSQCEDLERPLAAASGGCPVHPLVRSLGLWTSEQHHQVLRNRPQVFAQHPADASLWPAGSPNWDCPQGVPSPFAGLTLRFPREPGR